MSSDVNLQFSVSSPNILYLLINVFFWSINTQTALIITTVCLSEQNKRRAESDILREQPSLLETDKDNTTVLDGWWADLAEWLSLIVI